MFRVLRTVVLIGLSLTYSVLSASELVERIAFGSCLRQHQPQPVWDGILASRPDVFLFLGDNVYIDSGDSEVMREAYAELGKQPGYQALWRTARVHATWDDHDYGHNDAGAEFPMREISKRIFLDFFEIPAASRVRKRQGLYDAHVYGPEGRQIQVILLDTRYFRGPLKRGFITPQCWRIRYVPNDDRSVTMLGQAQWEWLRDQLSQPAVLRIIASSIQVIPEQHCFEKWANLPHERARLFRLFRETGANGVILISGDRHLAEISRIDSDLVGYPLYEITSSGLNSAGAGKGERNRYRIAGDNFREDNFGVISVDWSRPDPLVSMQVRDVQGRIRLQHRVSVSELRP